MAKIAKKAVDEKAERVTFGFMDGEKLACNLQDLPDDMIRKLALHGLSQKVGDSYASATSIDEAKQNARSVWGNLVAGVWATKAARGGKFVEALARVTGKGYDECLAAWSGMDDKQKAELKKHPQMKKAIAEIEAENAARAAEAASGEEAEAISFDDLV